MQTASERAALATRQALESVKLWEGFKVQAAASNWGNLSMLAAVATGKALSFNELADLHDMAAEG